MTVLTDYLAEEIVWNKNRESNNPTHPYDIRGRPVGVDVPVLQDRSGECALKHHAQVIAGDGVVVSKIHQGPNDRRPKALRILGERGAIKKARALE